MNFKKMLSSLVVMLAMTTVACGGEKSSEESKPAESTPVSSEPAPVSSEPAPSSSEAAPASSESTPASSESAPASSEAPAAHVHTLEAVTHEKGEGEVTEDVKKCKEDAYYEVSWDADDAAKTVYAIKDGSGFVDRKLKEVGDYVEYKIWSPVAMNARLYANAKYNKSNIKGVASSEHHTVWYDWRSDKDGFKTKVYLNGTEVDQGAQSVKINGQDITLKDLNFPDLGYANDSSEVLEMPWVSLQLSAGANTIKIERLNGYGHTYQTFVLKTILG